MPFFEVPSVPALRRHAVDRRLSKAAGSASGFVASFLASAGPSLVPSSDPSCLFGGRGSLGPLRGGPIILVLGFGRGLHLFSPSVVGA
jgi:hypothetical protein